MASKTSRKPADAGQFTVRSSPKVLDQIDALVALGLFGKTRAEVAEELMRAQLRLLHLEGWLKPRAGSAAKEGSVGQAGEKRSLRAPVRNRG